MALLRLLAPVGQETQKQGTRIESLKADLGEMADAKDEVVGPILFAVPYPATFVTGEVTNINGGSFPCG